MSTLLRTVRADDASASVFDVNHLRVAFEGDTGCPHVRPECKTVSMTLDVEANGHANACAFRRELPVQDATQTVREPRNPKLEKLFAAFEAMAARPTQTTGG